MVNTNIVMESSETNCVLLTSSDDENEGSMPKIINTISLQGCSTSLAFQDQGEEEDVSNLLYPVCEMQEENKAGETVTKEQNATEIEFSKENGQGRVKQEKKRIKLTQLNSEKHASGTKSFSSRRNDSHNVVDARNIALQESLFKTKELFDTFLRVCEDHETSGQMEKVVEKLSRAYGKAKQEYLGSVEFQNLLEAETEKVNTSSDKPWLNLKLVLDEMKHNKKLTAPKLKLGESEESQADAAASNDDEPVIECPKRRRHLKKLEKTLRALNLKIKKLEEREVDWSEDEDSPYIKLDRYRTQFTKVYNKVCEYKGKLPDADRPYLRKVSFAGTTYPHINRCIERFYNKHREFPDFQDIKKLVTIANEQENIQMPPIKIQEMAAAAFKEFGEMLKRLRQYDDYDVISSYLSQQVDPARDNKELQEQLNMNAMLFRKREQEVIDRFAAEEAGMGSELSDSKPKKKKILISCKKKPTEATENRNLSSSSGSSDEEMKEDIVKKNKPASSKQNKHLSSSSDDESTSTTKKSPTLRRKAAVKKEATVGKGKTLVGKNRIVKRGKVSKTLTPKTALSSDEESDAKDPKDSFANYLGLKGTSETKEAKIKAESDEEITSVQKLKPSPWEHNAKKSSSSRNSSDSESLTKTKPTSLQEIDIRSLRSTIKKSLRRSSRSSKTLKTEESNSSSETVSIKKNNTETDRRIEQKPKNAVSLKRIVNSNKRKRSPSSDNSVQTSDEESNESEKKDLSDAELSTGTKDLSPDSSDTEQKGGKEASDEDDAIIVLSEDTPVQPTVVKSVANAISSDSDDDIFVVSQNTNTLQSVAPRKTMPQTRTPVMSGNMPSSPKPVSAPRHSSLPTSHSTPPRRRAVTPPRRRAVAVTTSTPIRRTGDLLSSQLLEMSRRGSNKTLQRSSSSSSNGSSNNNGKQSRLPPLVNGAARKLVQSSCHTTTSPETIPLIVLD